MTSHLVSTNTQPHPLSLFTFAYVQYLSLVFTFLFLKTFQGIVGPPEVRCRKWNSRRRKSRLAYHRQLDLHSGVKILLVLQVSILYSIQLLSRSTGFYPLFYPVAYLVLQFSILGSIQWLILFYSFLSSVLSRGLSYKYFKIANYYYCVTVRTIFQSLRL